MRVVNFPAKFDVIQLFSPLRFENVILSFSFHHTGRFIDIFLFTGFGIQIG